MMSYYVSIYVCMYALSVSSCDKHDPHYHYGVFVDIVVLLPAYSYYSYNIILLFIKHQLSTALYTNDHPLSTYHYFPSHLMIIPSFPSISLCAISYSG